MVHITRRSFLKNSAALGLAAGVRVPPSERLHVACMGLRGRGRSLLHGFADQKDVVVTHLCDVDRSVLAARAGELEKKGIKAKRIKDYRSILDDKSVDALVIGTPDHWHALPTIHGCQAGKDIYVEKPDGHNINEGKMMVAASRKYKRMVQMGTQARSAPFLHDAAEFVRSGGIGKVMFGKAWESSRQGHVRSVPDSDPPKGVDYDLWLGPAPKRPFNRNRYHGRWRWFFDYGTGDLGNDGVHRMDYCRWVMGINEVPKAINCGGGKFFFEDAQEWPDTMMATFEYPGKLLTYEMRIWSRPLLHGAAEGAAVYGEEGWMLITNRSWKAFDPHGKVIEQGGDSKAAGIHIRNFLEAVKSRKRESLNQEIAQGHVSSVMCHAGNIAWRTGKKLRFDPETETFDDKEANGFLGREYRKGFELPDAV